jgi:integrase/recombinase XerD
LQVFLKYYESKSIADINNKDVIRFNNEFIFKNKLSASYQNQIVNAIKLYFTKVRDTKLNIDLVHRPKQSYLLPNVVSKEEIKQILTILPNRKLKAMLSLIYSCGLRRSELLNLKITDIYSKRNVLSFVYQRKR